MEVVSIILAVVMLQHSKMRVMQTGLTARCATVACVAVLTCVVRMVLRFMPSASQREEKSQPDSAPDAMSVYSCWAAVVFRPSAVATSSLRIAEKERSATPGCTVV